MKYNNHISEKNAENLYDYLCLFEKKIGVNFGNYDIDAKKVQKFLVDEDIFLGRLNKKDKKRSSKHKYSILFEATKPRKKKNDVAHHLLRHFRNSIAHANIETNKKDYFSFSDYHKENETMKGKLLMRHYFKLIELIIQTDKNYGQ